MSLKSHVTPLPSHIPRGPVIVTDQHRDDSDDLTGQEWFVWAEAPGVDRVWIANGKVAHPVLLERLRPAPQSAESPSGNSVTQ